jgi:hypothetical protein
VAVSLVALGCGGDGAASNTERDQAEPVTDAAEQTLSLDGFRIDGEGMAGGDSGEYTATYQAPDRASIVAGDGSITIFAGNQIYSSTSTDPESFTLFTADPDAALPVGNLLIPLRAVREAADVHRQGNRYVIDMDDGDGSIEVEIEDGFVTYIRMESQDEHGEFAITQHLSDFGVVSPIEPPPADQVTEVPEMPDCPPDDATSGEVVLCAPTEDDT